VGDDPWHPSQRTQPDASVGEDSNVNVCLNDARMPRNVCENERNVENQTRPRMSPRMKESAIQAGSELIQKKESKESTHLKPTFDICNVSRGKFNLKQNLKYSDRVGSPRKPSSGENFNGISIVSTPTKRKFDTKVSTLRQHFDDLSATSAEQSTVGEDNYGSPAKRRKWGRGQGGVRSVTPGFKH